MQSLRLQGNHQIFNQNNCRIECNHSIVNGSHCTVIGDFNIINGCFCRVVGSNNTVNGAQCQVQGQNNIIPSALNSFMMPNFPIPPTNNNGTSFFSFTYSSPNGNVQYQTSSYSQHISSQAYSNTNASIGYEEAEEEEEEYYDEEEEEQNTESLQTEDTEWVNGVKLPLFYKDQETLHEIEQCKICMSNKKSALMRNCNHTICYSCVRSIVEHYNPNLDDANVGGPTCPFCKQRINKVIRVFDM